MDPARDLRTHLGRLGDGRAGQATDPPVDGLLCTGDAACTTNPLYGRGVSLAVAHAYAVADLIAAHQHDDRDLTASATELARRLFTPWYLDAVATDRRRAAPWRSTMDGTSLPPAGPKDTLKAPADADPLVWEN